MNKILAVVVVLSLIEVIHGQAADDSSTKIDSKDKLLKLNIALIKKQIGEAYRDLDISIRQAQVDVTGKLSSLNDLVNVSTTKAKEQDKDVTECINAERATLKLIDLSQIQKCRKSPGLIASSIKISELGKLRDSLSNLASNCLVSNQEDASQVDPCVDDELARIDAASANTNQEIQSLINSSRPAANQCINDGKNNVQNSLDKAGQDLEQCVNGILQS